MRRSSRMLAVLLTSTALVATCGDSDDTGDADAEADTQIEGDRDTAECTGDEEVSTGDTLEESGEDPQGAVEDQQACPSGNEGNTSSGGGYPGG